MRTREEAEANFIIKYATLPRGPINFLNDYGYINSPGGGRIKWTLFDYQEEFILRLAKYKRNLILKSRQMGISWTIAGFALWLLLFSHEKLILFISSSEVHAKALLKKVKYLYANLPKSYKTLKEENICSLEILNPAIGTEIRSLTSGTTSGRGEAAYYVFIDEFAHIQHDEEVFNSVAFSTIHEGYICGVSTPRGMGNVFAELYHDEKNGWMKEIYHYNRYPNYPYKATCEMLGEKGKSIDQELECDFIQSGDPVFKQEDLEICFKLGKKIKIKEKKPKFFTGVDVAEGGAKGDFTSITSLALIPGVIYQADQFTERIPLKNMMGRNGILAKWHKDHPGPMMIEKNGPGVALLSSYQNEMVYPIQTTRINKPAMMQDLKYIIQKHQIALTDEETLKQLKVYQNLNNGSMGAPKSYKDDCVMSLAIALRTVKYLRNIDPGYSLLDHNEADKYMREI